MPVAHWRKGRPYPQMRRYTLWSFAFIAALPPLVVVLDLTNVEFTALDYAFLVALTALAVTAALSAAHLTLVQLEDRALRVPLIAAHVGLSIVAAALSFFYSGPTQELGLMGFSFTLSVVLSLSMLGIAAGLRTRVSLPLLLVLAVAVAASWQYGAQQLPDPPALADGRWFPALFSSLFLMLGITLGVRMSVWTLDRVYEQGAKAAVEAQLAVAEERLRFSRDLHDIFGRTLTAVVVKSELAAQLADAGQHERATTEMREVRALSDEALREVRAVVAGYRDVHLGTELAGARAMLAAAGITTRIIGDATPHPRSPLHRAGLGRARGGSPTWCATRRPPGARSRWAATATTRRS